MSVMSSQGSGRLLELQPLPGESSTDDLESVPLDGLELPAEREREQAGNESERERAREREREKSGLRRFVAKDEHTNEQYGFVGNRISTAKYNLVTFFPKFLQEQLSRTANMFFVFTAIIQQIPHVSPTGRFNTIGPLLVVLTMTAIKELLEDYKRHRADREVNNRRVKTFRDQTFRSIYWTDVKVGDIVKVLNEEYFPADLILLSSSEPEAMCYVETANLDGETNLKIRQGHMGTARLVTTSHIRNFEAEMECEGPNERLYKFVGNLNIKYRDGRQETLPMGPEQFLQRGAQLRNTPWIYGLVVYTGPESKLMKNSKAAPIKRSNVDNIYNMQIVYMFFVLIGMAIISAIIYWAWIQKHRHTDWYMGFDRHRPLSPALAFFTFIILYNNLIPISLIITIDIVKYFQAIIFINNDLDMYDESSDTPAVARTSGLNEELGQVQYIFSDKTGTLTQNEMVFVRCSIAGIAYGNPDNLPSPPPESNPAIKGTRFYDSALLDNLTNKHPTASIIREWLTLLAVCHTVVPERDRHDPNRIIYQAASPDEAALVQAVKALGFSFNVRQPDSVIINALGRDEKYKILNVLEFNSTRKRMSVIVQDERGNIKLYCKGADSVIFERLSPNQPFKEATVQHLREFASDGLRTLCLAVVQLKREEYEEWSRTFDVASKAIANRAQLLDDAAELIEKNLFLLGATAIEDRLQDGVPETIRLLADAGIKIWVCTGDKQETAINIGYSCKLLVTSMKLLIANEDSLAETQAWVQEQLRLYEQQCQVPDESMRPQLAMIIDGSTLEFALDSTVKDDWLRLGKLCKAVIACRVSPLQKAEIVRLVKNSEKAITLAIGDGANDVGMIQAAHVGVGISGKEGLQAARSSDYSIGQFRFLQKLLLVHGAWSYQRVSLLILYSFYKNIALYLIELWFAFDNGFSGQVLYEPWTIAAFNVFFTLLPPVAIGIFDQHLSAQTLLNRPHLYRPGQERRNFNTKVFWSWTLNAIYQSLLLYYLPRGVFRYGTVQRDGIVTGQWLFGNVVYSIVVYTVTAKAAMVMRYWTKYNHIAIWLSVFIWIFYTLIYSNFFFWGAPIGNQVAGVDVQMYRSGTVWFSFFLFPVVALFVDIIYGLSRRWFFPTEEDVLRKGEQRNQILRQMPMMVRNEASQMQHLGYAFSQNENTDAVTQAQVVSRYDTTQEKPLGD